MSTVLDRTLQASSVGTSVSWEHQFYDDVCLRNSVVQVGERNRVMAICKSVKQLEDFPKGIYKETFFLAGVDEAKGMERAGDDDIVEKNSFYLDWDVRKAHPEYSDEDIKNLAPYAVSLIDNCRYVVFSGNGLHLWFFGDPIHIENRLHWKMGLLAFVRECETLLSEKLDGACVNLSRLARLPRSFNTKGGEKKLVEIIHFSPCSFDLLSMERTGAKLAEVMEEENRGRLTLMQLENAADDTYHAIDKIPVSDILTRLKGWRFDGRNFYEPGGEKPKACFVPEGRNFLVHGGTDHLDPTKLGYGPFELAKALLKGGNADTFKWFRERYPHLKDRESPHSSLSEVFPVQGPFSDQSAETLEHDISIVSKELQEIRFDPLILGENLWELDQQKLILRGAVTRIGAFSNIGKSKVAYFLVHHLLKNGYKGMIFSTEVHRSIVLANLVVTQTGQRFWDIMDRRYVPTPEVLSFYKNLMIYDLRQTENRLERIEALLMLSKAKGKVPDFIVIDFVQSILPRQRGDGEYQLMSSYALEVQAMAQQHGIAIIDLSQISNEGLRDEYAMSGHIPFKGSGHLYSSADVGILLKRDKRDPNAMMEFDIRKNKYNPPKKLDLVCDFGRGIFKPFGGEFPPPEEAASLPF